ncbi:MAG: lyase [Gemmatimonadota bacterium]
MPGIARVLSAALVGIVLAAMGATAQDIDLPGAVEIREWRVPYLNSRPRDPYVAPDGRVWFVGQRTHYVAVLDPESGEFTRFPLDDGAGPHNLIVDDEGAIWYAGNRARHIGIMDPETGAVEKVMMPDEAARDPHTLVFSGDDHIWFTLQSSNKVGRLTRSTREVELLDVPTQAARPYGIAVDGAGRPWIAEVGTNVLGTVDPATMEYEEIRLPRSEARPRRIGLTTDGGVWYVDYAQGYVGRLDPETRAVREWRAPGAEQSGPYAMAIDDRDRIWFVETRQQPNMLIGFDPETEYFFVKTAIPSGGGSVRHMVFHAPTRTIWFGTDANTVGRVTVP